MAGGDAKARMARILRLHEEIDAIKLDIRDIYAEEKADGGDKTAMGAAVSIIRKREKDAAKFDDQQGMVDVYLTAYLGSGTVVATHTHASEPQPTKAAGQVEQRAALAISGERVAATSSVENEAAEISTPINGGTGMVLGTGKERPLSIGLHTDGDPEARFESASLHQEQQDAPHPARDLPNPPSLSGQVAPIQPETANELPPASRGIAGEDDLRELAATVPGQIAQEGDAPLEASANVTGEGMSGHAAHLSTDTENPMRTPAGVVVTDRNGVTGGESAAKDGGQKLSVSSAPASAIEFEDSASDAGQAPSTEQFPPVPMRRLPYADCFPAVLGAAYDRLGDDIATNGVQRPIVRMGDVIVNGWARYNICRALSVEYPVIQYSGNDVLMDVIAWQRRDRDFTPAQEKQLAAKLVKAVPHRAADILAAFDLAEEMAGAE